MKISPDNLSKSLLKELLPCYLISGDEPLLIQESLDLIRSTAEKEGFTSRDLYDQTQSLDWNEIINSCKSLSLFSEKKIIEIRLNSLRLGRDGSKSIIELIEEINDEVMVIISAPKLDKTATSTKWLQLIQKKGGFVQIWPLKDREIINWLRSRMRLVDLNANQQVIEMMSERVEGNLLAASQAIKKLQLYLGRGDVNETDIQRVVSDHSRYDVYQLVDSILKGNIKLGLKILHVVRREGTDAVVVIWAFIRELRVLSRIAKSVEVGSTLNQAIQTHRVWNSRKNIVASCVKRHKAKNFYNMIKSCTNADSVAKGQAYGNKWQLIRNIMLELSSDNLAS